MHHGHGQVAEAGTASNCCMPWRTNPTGHGLGSGAQAATACLYANGKSSNAQVITTSHSGASDMVVRGSCSWRAHTCARPEPPQHRLTQAGGLFICSRAQTILALTTSQAAAHSPVDPSLQISSASLIAVSTAVLVCMQQYTRNMPFTIKMTLYYACLRGSASHSIPIHDSQTSPSTCINAEYSDYSTAGPRRVARAPTDMDNVRAG